MILLRSLLTLFLYAGFLYCLFRALTWLAQAWSDPKTGEAAAASQPAASPVALQELEDGTFKLSHVCDESCQEALMAADVEAHR